MKTKWIVLLYLFIISSFFTTAHAEYYVVYTSQDYGSCCGPSCRPPSACNPMGCCGHLVPVEKSEYNEEEYQWIDP